MRPAHLLPCTNPCRAAVLRPHTQHMQISRLTALLEASKLHAALSNEQVRHTADSGTSARFPPTRHRRCCLHAMSWRSAACTVACSASCRTRSRRAGCADAHAAVSCCAEQLMADLADERLRAERLRAVRDDALMQRWVGWSVGQRCCCLTLHAWHSTASQQTYYEERPPYSGWAVAIGLGLCPNRISPAHPSAL